MLNNLVIIFYSLLFLILSACTGTNINLANNSNNQDKENITTNTNSNNNTENTNTQTETNNNQKNTSTKNTSIDNSKETNTKVQTNLEIPLFKK